MRGCGAATAPPCALCVQPRSQPPHLLALLAAHQAPKPSPLFNKPLGTCDVTQYAAEYTSMTGRSPYLRAKGAAAGAAK
jgi:hypothetical protein